MDANMKKTSKHFQLCAKPNVLNFPTTKPPFKSYNSGLTKLSTAVRVAIASLVPSIATKIHLGSINISNKIRHGPILQKKKNKHNSLSLCHYCDKSGHITIDYGNLVFLATKRQAVVVFMGNLIALVSYKFFLVKEKQTSLD